MYFDISMKRKIIKTFSPTINYVSTCETLKTCLLLEFTQITYTELDETYRIRLKKGGGSQI